MNKPESPRWLLFTVRSAGLLVLALGSLALLNRTILHGVLTKHLPAFPPMQNNSALCFVLAGAGLILCASRRRVLAVLFGLPVVLMGGLTILEYILGINLRIDQFFAAHAESPAGSPFPGRMPPNTAICFILSGFALLVAATPLRRYHGGLQIRLWGLMILILSSAALLSYLDIMILAYGGGHLCRMAAGSAAGFLVLGSGLLLLSRPCAEASQAGSSQLPLLSGLAVLLTGLFMWQALIVLEKANVEQTVKTQAELIHHEIFTELKFRAVALQRLARLWGAQEGLTEEEFRAEAGQIAHQFEGYKAMEWVDPAFRVRWHDSPGGGDPEQVGNPAENPVLRKMLDLSRIRQEPILFLNFPDGQATEPDLEMAVPLFAGETCKGFIRGLFTIRQLMQHSVPSAYLADYSVALMGGDETIFASTIPPPEYEREWAQESVLNLFNLQLRVKVIPTPRTLAKVLSPLPEVGLFFGVVVSSLFASTVQLAQKARRRAAEAEAATREREEEIDRRKLAEGELRRAQEDLERRVQERTRELARSNSELEQFAYVASHDLQEPLRMVTGYVELLARRYRDKLDEEAGEFIAYAVEGASRMQKLIEDLLAYSRVGRQGKPFTATRVEVVLDHVLANLEVAIRESGAEVTRGPLPTVMADATQLEQLFQNLISNSIKFRGRSPPRIHIGAGLEDGAWVLAIQDNGIGIDPRHFDRIFVIFQRLHTRREYTGTGIGLAICKRVVERHGGNIWVESAPGQGSVFKFTLPAERGAKWQPQATESLVSC